MRRIHWCSRCILTVAGIVAVYTLIFCSSHLPSYIHIALSKDKKKIYIDHWSPPINANLTAAGKNQTVAPTAPPPSEENVTATSTACEILLTSQGGVGSSSYLGQLAKYRRTNSCTDSDGLKHKAASCWKSHNSSSISVNGRCFSKVLVIIGDPLHTIER